MSSISTELPAEHEAELHVFGPGYGECLLVHIGHGEWVIVDSCLGPSKSPASLAWLSRIGVDPGTAVKLVVATHWHDDHVRGLAETFVACQNATFVCSSALLSDELMALARDSESTRVRSSSGVDELRAIVEELRKRKRASRQRLLGLGHKYASSNQVLLRRPGHLPCEIWSLSPSSAEFHASLEQFSQILTEHAEDRTRRRIVPPRPNNTAVVLWITIGSRVLLLGADLEERRSGSEGTAAADAGWTAIATSIERPPGAADVYKVAHHGSRNADTDLIWSNLLTQDVTVALTPFHNGSVKLPGLNDCRRILGRAQRAFISAKQARRYKPRNKVVAWAMEGKKPTLSPIPGHIWMRAPADPAKPWAVRLEEDACRLEDFVAA